jgi:LPXTG-motif cell wall-anchored protein
LICPQVTLNQNAGCQSPLDPIIRTILATTGGLSPWTLVAGLLLVVAGLAAFRRRTRGERRQQAAP